MENPKFDKILEIMRSLHKKKNSDYAKSDNPYSNFEFAAKIAAGFSDPVDKVFATMIGIKLARLMELTQPGRVAQNEPVNDTFLDLANYATIWTSYRYEQEKVYTTGQAEFSPERLEQVRREQERYDLLRKIEKANEERARQNPGQIPNQILMKHWD